MAQKDLNRFEAAAEKKQSYSDDYQRDRQDKKDKIDYLVSEYEEIR